MKLNGWDLAKLINIGILVRHAAGALCEVVSFDVREFPLRMPVRLKIVASGEEFDSFANEIVAVMAPIDREEPPKGNQAFNLRAA